MFLLEPVEYRPSGGTARAQQREQIPVLLRMMEALRKRVDVIDHRAEHPEVGLFSPAPDVVDEVEHAVQHRRQSAVLVVNDANGVQIAST